MSEQKKKFKRFNTSGLCFPEQHYMVDPLPRLKEVEGLIGEQLYFTIHAPRQTGKTTYLQAAALKLNAQGEHIAVVVSFEQAGYNNITVEQANELLIRCIYDAAFRLLPEKYRPVDPKNEEFQNIKHYLQQWCRALPLPLVLFIDEIDAIMDQVLISILRQLRDGFQGRPKHFPASVVLVGLRDVREYKASIRENMASLGTASPFNIKSDSLFLKNFTREEVFFLLEQHGSETGQVFPEAVKEKIFSFSAGQPWLTNALARQIIYKILEYDFSKEITVEMVNQAKNQLIERRDTHLDSLVDKLKEDRIKRIVLAIVNGEILSFDILDDDIAYARDLGIITQTDPIEFANPIYAEIVPRIMASPMQASIPKEFQTPRFVKPDGSLDMDKLLKEFQTFYMRNSAAWQERYLYKESAHHLLLMSFLQRIINSGGEITREMAVGNRRIDLYVKYGKQEFALELKMKWDSRAITDGKEQLHDYLDTLGLNEGYLIVFDPSDKEWQEKIYWQEVTHKNKKIIIVGL